MWDTIKQSNIHTVGVPGGDEREKRSGRIFEEIVAEHVPNLMKDMNINIQEAQQNPSKMNSKKPTLKHTIIKLSKDKDRESWKQQVRSKSSYTILNEIIDRFLIRNFRRQKTFSNINQRIFVFLGHSPKAIEIKAKITNGT